MGIIIGTYMRALRTSCASVIIAGVGFVSVAVAAPQDEVAAPISQFINAFNKGDVKTAASANVDEGITIIDEFPPHHWAGKTAFADWMADFDKEAKAKGITKPLVRISKPTRIVSNETNAYVIVRSVYTFNLKDVAMGEVGQMTFALTHGTTGWKISGWTWTGPEPHPTAKKAEPKKTEAKKEEAKP